MEKTGFTYERSLIHATLPHVLYRLHAPHQNDTMPQRRS